MNESLDLRNRILKMRESNNIVLNQVKSESEITETNSEIIKKTQRDLHSEKVNLETKLENEFFPAESKKIENPNFFKSNSINSNQQTFDNLVNDNEAQFRMIAKKFNEAVEVILELSDKVKKLEETVYNLSYKSNKNKKNYYFFKLKTFVLIIITTLILLCLFTIPIDLTLIKLIITDVISSI